MISSCASDEVKMVNIAGLSHRVSPTDSISRKLAMNSQNMLTQRREDYRVGPGDLLDISIFEWELREETKTAVFRVAESGFVSLPVIGDLTVKNLTVGQVKLLLELRLKRGGFIQAPRVSVDIKEFRSKRVAVIGAVRDPGVYTLRQNVTTFLDILSLAGGVSERAGYISYVIRPDQMAKLSSSEGETGGKSLDKAENELITIDLYQLMEKGDMSLNMVLGNGDTINVPEAAKFSVIGYVRQPNSFPLKKPTTVLEGLAMAGGLRENEASPRSCILKRFTSVGELIINLDLVDIASGEKPNIYLEPNDIIEVRQTMVKYVFTGVLDSVLRVFNFSYWIGGSRN